MYVIFALIIAIILTSTTTTSASTQINKNNNKIKSAIPIIKNEIKALDVKCDSETFNVTVTLKFPFKGKIFAKEFSGAGCSSFGSSHNDVTLSLPTYGCGMRLSTKTRPNSNEISMEFSVNLAVQQDKFLHQFTDQEVMVKCKINPEQFEFRNDFFSKQQQHLRNGRMRKVDENNVQTGKAWMEIVSEENNAEKLQVGEATKLMIKSTLPAGIGWKIVDCTAHDGLGDSSQKLIDEHGCPIDDQIMPKMSYKTRNLAQQEAITIFPAFKFPDRDRLHLSCMMLLCKNECSKLKCNQNSTERTGKQYETEEILDQIKIFNSVEVLAPTISEYSRYSSSETTRNDNTVDASFTFPGDETLCISYNKIALTFCILGLVFLTGILIATGGLLKSRRNTWNNALSVYTRSIFSTSSGCSSQLLNDQSSFSFASTGGLHYNRI